MIRQRETIESLLLLVGARTGWSRAEIAGQSLRRLCRQVRQLNRK